MKATTSYKAMDVEPVLAHPIDHAVYVRVGRPRLQAELGRKAQAVVEALGRRRRLWFADEALQGRLTSLREAAFFDLGVAHGVAEARAGKLRGRRKAVERLVGRLVREALGANVARDDAVAAAVLAAWAILGRSAARRPISGRGRARAPG